MKTLCLQENLVKGLSMVARAVPGRSTLPVLSTILLTTGNGHLRLAATNLELGITCQIEAKTEEDWSVAIPAKPLVDLVSAFPREEVRLAFTARTQTLSLKCGRVQANLKGIEAKEFPLIPQADPDTAICADATILKEMISQVASAASDQEIRPILKGVLMVMEDDQITLAAADGFRLAERKAKLSVSTRTPLRLIIPAANLAELAHLITLTAKHSELTDEDSLVMINTIEAGGAQRGTSHVIFHHHNVEVISQLIEGEYPDYAGIIPDRYQTRAVVSTEAMRRLCKTTDVFAREANHLAVINIKPSSEQALGQITLSAEAAETGENTGDLEAQVEGSKVEIAFNLKYLLTALGTINTSNVALEVTTPTSPGVVRPVDQNDLVHVIMPLHR